MALCFPVTQRFNFSSKFNFSLLSELRRVLTDQTMWLAQERVGTQG